MADETLGQKQRRFAKMVVQLLNKLQEMGYEYTWGDAYRDPRVHGEWGQKRSYSAGKSVHKMRLAVDLNLFKDGKYLTKTEDHRPLGEFWESIGGTWGGRWNDGNHYSLPHQGCK